MTQPARQLNIPVNAVIDVGLHAADLVLAMRREGLQDVRSKSSASDIVTEADVASEKLIRTELSELDGSLGFWGEESNRQPDEPLFWIVDPIDGTNNFAMGLPLFAVNIALQNGPETVLGVTVALPDRRVYWAEAGRGAYLRYADGSEQRLVVRSAERLQDVFLTTGFPYHRAENADNNSAEHAYLLSRAQGIRCLGASAMDLAFVASGALGGYWEAWIKPWDAAPGALMVREAGGQVTTYAGDEWTLTDNTLVASNGRPGIHNTILDGIRSARAGLSDPLF
jgi:myo-inositol-1(or 4)-monophosphatase